MNLQTYTNLIIEWANNRQIIQESTEANQLVKLVEELGELASGIARHDVDIIKDSVGDCYVVATVLSGMIGCELEDFTTDKLQTVKYNPFFLLTEWVGRFSYDLNRKADKQQLVEGLNGIVNALIDCANKYKLNMLDCVKAAYDEIKHRKGVMINGVFVKEADLQAKLEDYDRQITNLINGELTDVTREQIDVLHREALTIQDNLVKALR